MAPIDLFDDLYDDPDDDQILFTADLSVEQLCRYCKLVSSSPPDISRRRIDGAKTLVLFLLAEESSYVDGPSEEEQDMISHQVDSAFESRLVDLILNPQRQPSMVRGPFEEALFSADISLWLIERFCQLVCASHSNIIAREELAGARQLLQMMLDEETQFEQGSEEDDTELILQTLNTVFDQYIAHLGGST